MGLESLKRIPAVREKDIRIHIAACHLASLALYNLFHGRFYVFGVYAVFFQ